MLAHSTIAGRPAGACRHAGPSQQRGRSQVVAHCSSSGSSGGRRGLLLSGGAALLAAAGGARWARAEELDGGVAGQVGAGGVSSWRRRRASRVRACGRARTHPACRPLSSLGNPHHTLPRTATTRSSSSRWQRRQRGAPRFRSRSSSSRCCAWRTRHWRTHSSTLQASGRDHRDHIGGVVGGQLAVCGREGGVGW